MFFPFPLHLLLRAPFCLQLLVLLLLPVVTEILPGCLNVHPPPLGELNSLISIAFTCSLEAKKDQRQSPPGTLHCDLLAPAVHVHDSLTSSAPRRSLLPLLLLLLSFYGSRQGASPFFSSSSHQPHSEKCVWPLGPSIGASTLAWQMHLVNLNLPLKVFKGCLSFQALFSRNGAAVFHPWVSLLSHIFREMLRPLHIKGRLDVHASKKKHRSSFLAGLPVVFLSLFLPLPELLQQLRNRHLEMPASNPVSSANVQPLPAFGFSFPFPT